MTTLMATPGSAVPEIIGVVEDVNLSDVEIPVSVANTADKFAFVLSNVSVCVTGAALLPAGSVATTE